MARFIKISEQKIFDKENKNEKTFNPKRGVFLLQVLMVSFQF
jgi:hypothetical protein